MRKRKPVRSPSRTADKFIIRLPPGMRERITTGATINRRSMNSEIISRLQRSFEQTSAIESCDPEWDSAELSPREWKLLQQFRQLAHPQQQALVSFIEPEGS